MCLFARNSDTTPMHSQFLFLFLTTCKPIECFFCVLVLVESVHFNLIANQARKLQNHQKKLISVFLFGCRVRVKRFKNVPKLFVSMCSYFVSNFVLARVRRDQMSIKTITTVYLMKKKPL